MAKLLPLETVPGLSRAEPTDPLYRAWLERISRNTEQQSRLLRSVPTGTAHPQAAASGLVINIDGSATRRVTANEIWLKDAENNPEPLRDVSYTFGAGFPELDTGVYAVSTWYYIWLVWNGSTTRGLVSRSFSDPVMPAGYTHKGLCGAVYNNAAGSFVVMYTQGLQTHIARTTVLSLGTSTVATAVSLSTAAPPIGRFVSGWMQTYPTGGTGSFGFLSLDGVRGEVVIQGPSTPTLATAAYFRVPYASSQVFYLVGAATFQLSVFVTGWEF